MESLRTLTAKLPHVHHLCQAEQPYNLKGCPRKNKSVQALDNMLTTIVSSVEPTERTTFVEAVANTSSSRKGIEQLMIQNLVACSSPFGSASGSTEALPQSQLSNNENVTIVRKPDTPTPGFLQPLTPPKERTSQSIPNIDKLTRHLMIPNDSSDEAMSVPRTRRQITIKHYSDATPSMHCHICCRSSKNIKVYACARIKEAICRKVVCSRCFIDNNWKHKEGWECSHCRGICPIRSQCFTYGRSNLRRKIQASKRKLEKSQKSLPPIHGATPKFIAKKYVADLAKNFVAPLSLAEAVGRVRSREMGERAVGH